MAEGSKAQSEVSEEKVQRENNPWCKVKLFLSRILEVFI